MKPVRRVLKALWRAIKVVVLAVMAVEVLSFLLITASNFVFYGGAREGYGAVYDPYTLFLVADNVHVSRDKDGRDPVEHKHVASNPANHRTIWIFGGSTTRGFKGPDEKTIARFLAERLNSSGGPLSFTVVNFGVPSFNSLLEVKYLQKALIERNDKPDLIIFYDGANEAKYFAEHRTADAHHGYRRTKALIESYSKSWFGVLKPLNAAIQASFTKEIYDKLTQILAPIEPNSPLVQDLVRTAVRRYDYVHSLARGFGAEFLLVWQPMIWVERCSTPHQNQDRSSRLIRRFGDATAGRNNFAVPYEALMDALKDKPYFANCRDILCDSQVQVYTPDGVHLRDEGNRFVAEKLAPIVVQWCQTHRATRSATSYGIRLD
ncbi:MAG: SGNH/GDSL hydrolase family protein [Desulfomonile sp.]|nr:SGNH/GDSL hydrolase family protein [Desulfomonile sp.]